MPVASGGWWRRSGRGWASGVLAAGEEVLSERGIAAEVVKMRDRGGRCGRRRSRDGTGSQPWAGMGR